MLNLHRSRGKTCLAALAICVAIVAFACWECKAIGNVNRQKSKETPKEAPKSLRVALSGTALQPFVGKLQIGDPAQAFKVLFDTSSPRLWVISSDCDLDNAPWRDANKHARFYGGRSFSYKPLEGHMGGLEYPDLGQIQLTYKLATETVHLEDMREPTRPFQIHDQPLAVICWMYGQGARFNPPTDGVAGLRPPATGTENEIPLYANLALNELVTGESIFTLYTYGRPTTNASQPVAGELTFGGEPDKMRYTGPISWAPVTRKPQWEIRVHTIRLRGGGGAPADGQAGGANQSDLAAVCVHGCQAQLKTGTKYIVGPQEEVAALNNRLGFKRSGNFFSAPHSCAQHEPRNLSLEFKIGANVQLELPPEMLWFDVVAGEREHCISIIKGQDNGSSWTLGAPFISNFYTIFDHGRARVGFARPVRARTLRD